jgi:plasmid stability protein
MATLNIKGFPDALYRKLKSRAKRQHRSVTQEITHILSDVLSEAGSVSVLELQGLGKELWAGVNATKHVEDERRSWD